MRDPLRAFHFLSSRLWAGCALFGMAAVWIPLAVFALGPIPSRMGSRSAYVMWWGAPLSAAVSMGLGVLSSKLLPRGLERSQALGCAVLAGMILNGVLVFIALMFSKLLLGIDV